jgi:hypothetical protein
MNRRAIVMMLVLALAMISMATPALAQTSTARGYDESQVLGELENPPPPNTPPKSTSSLPFTGLDLAVVVLMGAGLLGTGLVIRRNVSSRPE